MGGLLELVDTDHVRTLRLPEHPRLAVHEVLTASMLRSVTADRSHPYDYAIETMHGDQRDVRVAMNAAAVLRRELRRRSWRRSTVAVGVTGLDPYAVMEERYRLMPGVISALAESVTPFALHTGSALIARDVPLLRMVAHVVPTTVVVRVPSLDDELCLRADPAGSAPAGRIDAVRRLAEAGLEPQVRIAPLLPLLTDSSAQLDALLGALSDAGAARVSVSVLQLDDDGRHLDWLAQEHPALLRRYRTLYGRGTFVSADYAVRLRERMTPLVEAHGLARHADEEEVAPVPTPEAAEPESLTLF